MKFLITLIILFFLTGCYAAKYTVKKYDPETGALISDFGVQSRRQLEQLNVDYDGVNKTFKGSVGKATSTPSPMEKTMSNLLPVLLEQALLGIPGPVKDNN